MSGHLFDLPAATIDERTAALLQEVAGSPDHAVDRVTIVRAVVAEADEHSGYVCPNRLRGRLQLQDGRYVVQPQVIGAVLSALTRAGCLRAEGPVASTDARGGNTNKYLVARRLVRVPTLTETTGGAR